MKLTQLVADNFAAFSRMNPENREICISSVHYISNLANTNGVDISDWDIVELFGTGQGKLIRRDRREINKIFMTNMKTPKKPRQPKVASLDHLNDSLNGLISSSSDEREGVLTDRYLEYRDEAKNLYEEYLRQLRQAASIRRKMDHKKGAIDFVGQIKQIVDDSFWSYHKFQDGALIFRTRDDIIVREVNKKANINLEVNLGKMEARFDVANCEMSVHKFENNVFDPYDHQLIHPHACDEVCWGSAAETAEEMSLALDLVNLMRLLANLLMDYCPDNPFATLHSFKFWKVSAEIYKDWVVKRKMDPDELKKRFEAAGLSDGEHTKFLHEFVEPFEDNGHGEDEEEEMYYDCYDCEDMGCDSCSTI